VIVNLLSKEKTAGGIYLPETAKENRLARVEAIGEGQRYMDGAVHPVVGLKVGDLVLITLNEHGKIPDARYIGVRADNRIMLMEEEIVAVAVPEAQQIEA